MSGRRCSKVLGISGGSVGMRTLHFRSTGMLKSDGARPTSTATACSLVWRVRSSDSRSACAFASWLWACSTSVRATMPAW